MSGNLAALKETSLPTPFPQIEAEVTRSEFRQEGTKAPPSKLSRLRNGNGGPEALLQHDPQEPELTFLGQIAAPRSGKTVAPPASTSLIWEHKA